MPTSLFSDGIGKDDDISSIDTGNDEFLDWSAHYEGGDFLPQPDEAVAAASAISSAVASSYSGPEPSNMVRMSIMQRAKCPYPI